MTKLEILQMYIDDLNSQVQQSPARDNRIAILIDERNKAINYIPCCEQLTVKEWEIDFGGDVLAGLEITNNEPKIIGAMNGWGNGIDKEAITITQK